MRRTVAEHQAAVAGLLQAGSGTRRAAEVLALRDAPGRALAEDVKAPVSLPPFDNAQMDGYAVHAADLAGTAPLTVADPIPAAVRQRLLHHLVGALADPPGAEDEVGAARRDRREVLPEHGGIVPEEAVARDVRTGLPQRRVEQLAAPC